MNYKYKSDGYSFINTSEYPLSFYSTYLKPITPTNYFIISSIEDDLVSLSSQNFFTHNWENQECTECGLWVRIEDDVLKSDKNISCGENKLSKLLK